MESLPSTLQFGALGVLAVTLTIVLRFFTNRVNATSEFVERLVLQSLEQMAALVTQNQKVIEQNAIAQQAVGERLKEVSSAVNNVSTRLEEASEERRQMLEDHRNIVRTLSKAEL